MRYAPEKFESRPDEAAALTAQGFSRIPLPTAFPIPPINVILIQGPEGNALIDTGMNAHDSLLRLEIALQLRGIRWTDLNAVYFTHPHLDHFGLASDIARRSGASLHAWEPSAHRFEKRQEHFAHEQVVYEEWLREGGFADTTYPRPTYSMDTLEAPTITGSVPVDEEFSMVGHPVQAFHVPGHSPWCIAYWFPEARFLVSGDFLLEHISPNAIVYPPGSSRSRLAGAGGLSSQSEQCGTSTSRACHPRSWTLFFRFPKSHRYDTTPSGTATKTNESTIAGRRPHDPSRIGSCPLWHTAFAIISVPRIQRVVSSCGVAGAGQAC